ncbi:hypothetical protein [Neptunomonas phycophila]|uniref:hypothetical protein n=1 Tax=Neptunomonas phycophila TaxID=1572645 RepID=UPI003516676A
MAIYHRPYESDGDEDQASGDVCALNVNVHGGVYVELKETYLDDSDYGGHHHAGARGYDSILHAHEYESGYRSIEG